jgi:hypothetical protein
MTGLYRMILSSLLLGASLVSPGQRGPKGPAAER